MACNCHSYNADKGLESEVILKNPHTGYDVSLDACIADQIKMLWDNEIQTGGSCCGHNGLFPKAYGGPQVVLMESFTLGANTSEAQKAKELLKKHDKNRQWKVYAWKLCEM